MAGRQARFTICCPRCGGGLFADRQPDGIFIYYCKGCMWGCDELELRARRRQERADQRQMFGEHPARGVALASLWLISLSVFGSLPAYAALHALVQGDSATLQQVIIWLTRYGLAVSIYWIICLLLPTDGGRPEDGSLRVPPFRDQFGLFVWMIYQSLGILVFFLLLPGRLFCYTLFSTACRLIPQAPQSGLKSTSIRI